jgi:hypothetical protein
MGREGVLVERFAFCVERGFGLMLHFLARWRGEPRPTYLGKEFDFLLACRNTGRNGKTDDFAILIKPRGNLVALKNLQLWEWSAVSHWVQAVDENKVFIGRRDVQCLGEISVK